jgi:phytoene dehydrogenase-like protein
MLYQKTISKNYFDVIIVGSGMAGLSCACFLANAGLSVLVLEQHLIPGGATTMFQRGKFLFEGGGHRVTGIRNPGGALYELLHKIGKEIRTNPIEPSYVVKIGAKTLHASLDLPTYEENAIKLFPREKENIQRFLVDMQKMKDAFAYVSSGKVNPLVLLTKHRLFLKYSSKTTAEVLKKYFNEEETATFMSAVGNYTTLPLSRQSFLAFSNIWAAHHIGEGMSLIEGGTKTLVDALVEYIDSHNGQVAVSQDVQKIIIENKKTVGVLTKKGESIRAKVVISATSNEETYLKLIDSEHLKPPFIKKIQREQESGSLFQAFLGVQELDGSGLENVTTFALGYDNENHLKKIYNWDLDAITSGAVITVEGKENAPALARSVNISCLCPFEHPQNWYIESQDRKEYNAFKEKIGKKMIASMSKYIPNLESRILLTNYATPLTIHRYARATRGGLQGLAHTVAQSGKSRGKLQSPISNLYRTGQYVFPGAGIVTVCISAKLCSQMVLRNHF